MEQWVEVAKIFGTGVTAGTVMGLWIYSLVGQVSKLETRNEKLTDHIRESEASHLKLLMEMKALMATLIDNQDRLPQTIKDALVNEVRIINQAIKNLGDRIG